MACAGAYTALLMRWEIGFPNKPVPGWGLVSPDKFNALITMHGTIMIFFVGMPILVGALSNFVIPLQIGARDMAFPKINMLSYWFAVVSALLIISTFFVPGGPAAGGWTGYPPLSADSQYTGVYWGVVLWLLALAVLFVSSTMGGINYLVTVICMRAKGMTYFRLPLMIWFLMAATLAFFFSVGPLIAAAFMLLMDNVAHTGFFLPAKGGEPLLWQHLFWFFGHPEVYVILFPALGAISEILPVFTRKPIVGYRTIVYCTLSALILSYVVWAHHMFVSGINPALATPFSLATILISVPFAIIMLCMLASLWGGSIRYKTPMIWALGFLGTFLVGGLTGIFLGAASVDIFLHGTYFVVAHFHYTMFPSVFIGGFAAVYYWYPKMFGRMYNEKLGALHAILTLVFFNCTFWPLFTAGSGGMVRRIADPSWYHQFNQFIGLNHFVTVAAYCLIATQTIFLYNFFHSLVKGPKAPENPWEANTMEWTTPTPPPHGNWPGEIPTVYGGPYEYSKPGLEKDFLPQTDPQGRG